METSTPRKKKEEPDKKRNFELENHCVRNWCLRARAILRTSPKSFWKKFEKVLNMDKMQKFPPCLLFTHNLCQWKWTRKSIDKCYGRFFVWNEYGLLLVKFLPIHVIAIFLSPFDFILKHVYFLCKDTNNGYKYSPRKNRKTVLQMIVVYRSALLIKYSCT